MNEGETRAELIALSLKRSYCGLCWLNPTHAAALWSPPAWRVAEATHAMPVR
jgi:hypothetical protein